MAENENKKKNTEGLTQAKPQGNQGGKAHSGHQGSKPQGGNQGGKPPHKPHGKGHFRSHGPRKDVKVEGSEAKPKQDKATAEHTQPKSQDKRPRKPQKDLGKPKQEGKRSDNKRTDTKRSNANAEEGAVKGMPLSPRRRQLQEKMTADQKAFNDATDILLSEDEKRKSNAVANEAPEATVEVVGIRFKSAGKIYYFAPAGISFEVDDGAIVETSRGQEYGFVVIANRMVDEKETVRPLKPVVRKATAQDNEKYKKNKELEARAASVWESLVEKHKLTMSLTDIEYTFDNSKLIFYFTAEGRVDFRELVKDLAAVFRTRIELRQIGVRDEAKMLGGLGVCGMPFCCHRFLSDFVQVSIKMAKEQNLSLSSAKISGNCGRLMCCLSYEQAVYDAEYLTFPKTGMLVRTAQGAGTVVESNFLNNKVKVRLDGGEDNGTVRIFPREEVKVIGKSKRAEAEENDSELKELKELED